MQVTGELIFSSFGLPVMVACLVYWAKLDARQTVPEQPAVKHGRCLASDQFQRIPPTPSNQLPQGSDRTPATPSNQLPQSSNRTVGAPSSISILQHSRRQDSSTVMVHNAPSSSIGSDSLQRITESDGDGEGIGVLSSEPLLQQGTLVEGIVNPSCTLADETTDAVTTHFK